MTRAQRNNNPGNIDRGQVPWMGERRDAAALAQESRFAVFIEPAHGYRAIGKLLLAYQDRHGIHTVRGLINRWAPPQENDTGAYVAAVANAAGINADEATDLTHGPVLWDVVKAIAHHESGFDPFPDADLAQGLAMLGLA